MKHILISNKWRTPDGTLLISKHTHDFVSYKDANGEEYFVDGGNEYCRMSMNDIPMTSECVYADDDFEKVRLSLLRGTFGVDKKGGEHRIWLPMYKMSDSHICNTITYCGLDEDDTYDVYIHLYIKELIYRFENGLHVADRKYTVDESDKPSQYETVPAVTEMHFNPKVEYCPDFEYLTDTLNKLSEQSGDKGIREKAYFELKRLDHYWEKKYGKE